MKNVFKLFYLTIFMFSCSLLEDNNDEECNKGDKPYDCIESRPSHGTLTINVTINALNPKVPIEIFKSNYIDERLYLRDTLTTSSKKYYTRNSAYAVKAIYKKMIDGKIETLLSVNSGDLSAEKTEYCDGYCYEEGSEEIEVTD